MSAAIFIPSDVDDAELTPLQFRLLGHLSRRAGRDGHIYSSIANMAKVCGLASNTIKIALRELKDRNIVITEQREGDTALRRINPTSVWRLNPARKTTGVEKRPGLERGTGPSKKSVPRPSTKSVPVRYSSEGTPSEGAPPSPPRGGAVEGDVVEELYQIFPRKETWKKKYGEKQIAKNAIRQALTKVDLQTVRAAIARYRSELLPSQRCPGYFVSQPDKLVDTVSEWFGLERWKIYNFPAVVDTAHAENVASREAAS